MKKIPFILNRLQEKRSDILNLGVDEVTDTSMISTNQTTISTNNKSKIAKLERIRREAERGMEKAGSPQLKEMYKSVVDMCDRKLDSLK